MGLFVGQLIDLSLSDEISLLPEQVTRQRAVRQLQESDFQVILRRNLFDSQAAGQSAEQIDLTARQLNQQSVAPVRTNEKLSLIGTVVAGEDSLALIQIGSKAGVFHLEDELAPGIVVMDIARQMVVLRDRGVRRELVLKKQLEPQAKRIRQGQGPPRQGVVAMGENRWRVSAATAQAARANLNKLLQSARMIPQVQNGQTIGFKLVELERGSLLEQVGLRVGDILVEINQVELNSPEKALQIFQQVREANNISLGLVRSGQRKTFEYSFE